MCVCVCFPEAEISGPQYRCDLDSRLLDLSHIATQIIEWLIAYWLIALGDRAVDTKCEISIDKLRGNADILPIQGTLISSTGRG